jgi:DNA-binding NarL/FixJ family response regulator
VVLITAHTDPEVRSRALMLGAFAVLSKPCDVEQLKGMVELALAK